MSSRYETLTLGELLDDLGARTPAPGGGAAAGLVLAMAAGLCGMAARFSGAELPEADRIAVRADEIRARAVELAESDAAAFAGVLAARRLSPSERSDAVSLAMADAVAIPLEVAEEASELADLAGKVASGGNRNLLGDALAAVVLAEAAGTVAARLAEINIAGSGGEDA